MSDLKTPWKVSSLSNHVNSYIEDATGQIIFGSVGDKRLEVCQYLVETLNKLHPAPVKVQTSKEYFQEIEDAILKVLKEDGGPMSFLVLKRLMPDGSKYGIHLNAVLLHLVGKGKVNGKNGQFSIRRD